MTKPNKGPGYSQCPGVPALNHKCIRRIRTRKMCSDCERSAAAGRLVGMRRCPGVPAVGHSCNIKIRSRLRCRRCEYIYIKYQNHLSSLKQKIDRDCLKCGKKFVANNRFLRLCKNCRESNHSSTFNGYDETLYTISVGRR